MRFPRYCHWIARFFRFHRYSKFFKADYSTKGQFPTRQGISLEMLTACRHADRTLSCLIYETLAFGFWGFLIYVLGKDAVCSTFKKQTARRGIVMILGEFPVLRNDSGGLELLPSKRLRPEPFSQHTNKSFLLIVCTSSIITCRHNLIISQVALDTPDLPAYSQIFIIRTSTFFCVDRQLP